MIRKVKREWSKKEKAFHTVDAWGDKKLPEINSAIKQMDRDALKAKLKSLKLSEIGAKDVLVTRLKNHYKKLFLAERAGPNYQEKFISVEYFVALDFEATCIEENGPNYPHEIIEFPAVLVEVETGKTIAKFHSYVRPRINPLLSEFCTKLTGISQSQVDNAPYFPAVFKMFQEWLVENNLLVRYPNGLLKIEESTSSWTFVTGTGHRYSHFRTDIKWGSSSRWELNCQMPNSDKITIGKTHSIFFLSNEIFKNVLIS